MSKAEGALAGKIALVTGAAGGMGKATAELFAAEGAVAFAADIQHERGAPAISGERLHIAHLDVTQEAAWAELVGHILGRFGQIDILVNNAGIQREARLEDTSPELYDQIYRVNQLGPFLGMRAVVPAMKAAKSGAIINISSTAGLGGYRNMTAYVATKFALRGMTKVAALELGSHNIRVNSIHPGLVDTPMTRALGETWVEDVARHVPLRRAGQPRDIAQLALFLASDASSFCSGGEYICDGASTAGPRS